MFTLDQREKYRVRWTDADGRTRYGIAHSRGAAMDMIAVREEVAGQTITIERVRVLQLEEVVGVETIRSGGD
jgi:hypothetical protein